MTSERSPASQLSALRMTSPGISVRYTAPTTCLAYGTFRSTTRSTSAWKSRINPVNDNECPAFDKLINPLAQRHLWAHDNELYFKYVFSSCSESTVHDRCLTAFSLAICPIFLHRSIGWRIACTSLSARSAESFGLASQLNPRVTLSISGSAVATIGRPAAM